MVNDAHRLGLFRQQFGSDFVIGLILGGDAKGYYFSDVRTEGIINDAVGEHPVMIWADEQNYHAYLRVVAGQELTFELASGEIWDRETGSRSFGSNSPGTPISISTASSCRNVFNWRERVFPPGWFPRWRL